MDDHAGKKSTCGQEMGNNEFSWSEFWKISGQFPLSWFMKSRYNLTHNHVCTDQRK